MIMFNPLHFQKKAVEKLTYVFLNLWKRHGRQLPIVFKAPTGSGKTYMSSLFVRALNSLPQWKEDKAFIWITFSDDLAMQSRDKFHDYFGNMLENRLLTVADIDQGKLYANDILFLNWQKIVARTAKTRLLRRPDEEEWRKESGKYFEDVIEQTKADGRHIILIIDEAHKNVDTKLAHEIVDFIDPKVVLHVSATPEPPIVAEAAEYDSYIKIDRHEVISEGLIKEGVALQSEEDLQKLGGKDLDKALLELGIAKRNQLKEELIKLGKSINPLMLIQLPNDDSKLVEKGEKRKEEIVTEYLLRNGISERKIAKWFDKNPRPLGLEDGEDEHDFLLFKQAAGTGWDCPRAYVLVMFREIQSNTFYVQTVGRILRMPEPERKDEYKNNPNLRLGYLYTNYKRKEVEIPDESKENKPLTKIAYIRSGINNIHIPSDYLSRLNYGDINVSSEFQMLFKSEFNKYFSIVDKDVMGEAEKKLTAKGVNLENSLVNEIVANAQLEDYDNLAYEFVRRGTDISYEMSVGDIEKTFNYYCYLVLKEQEDEQAKYSNIARSWATLKQALRVWFKTVLHEDHVYWYRVFIKDVRRGPESVFRRAITQALRAYKPISNKLLEDKKRRIEQREAHIFSIQNEYKYPDDYVEVPQRLYALDKFFLPENYDGRKNELGFVEYIDRKENVIEWWFKNGDQSQNYLGMKYKNTETGNDSIFYPDWIIKFKDGRVGIFDTKKGNTATSSETADKAAMLQTKLKELGKGFVGGIVVQEAGIWYYNDSPEYLFKEGMSVNDSKDWKPMENLFK